MLKILKKIDGGNCEKYGYVQFLGNSSSEDLFISPDGVVYRSSPTANANVVIYSCPLCEVIFRGKEILDIIKIGTEISIEYYPKYGAFFAWGHLKDLEINHSVPYDGSDIPQTFLIFYLEGLFS